MSYSYSLVVCTYMRAKPLLTLLKSVEFQTLCPDEILIIDGSTNDDTEKMIHQNSFKNLKYYKVDKANRGLTKQRNYGVNLVGDNIEIVCFLDDDTELENNYFKELVKTYSDNSIIGAGGVSVNENQWYKPENISQLSNMKYYKIDDYAVKEGLRNVVRNYCGLQSPLPPSVMPNFSHGRTCSYPLNNKIYNVDLLIGMSFSFKKSVFNHIKFSTYFEGYGLYEDADFSLRALKYGKNAINTAAKLNHYHDHSGRPNKFNYGKMVVRNGWYVWRVKYPNPTITARFKWNATSFLLTLIRFTNVINTKNRKEALTEGFGRIIGWFSLLFNAPKID